ncbi:VOC family protein [Sphingomonas profundi]|uniref:VOC family protein n=1 Tax=Alterirhizorhabdus profundi TaxID=2681549 RepID=UPI0012E8F4BE|nr:VOC family protein [Sphingomonas profundi]
MPPATDRFQPPHAIRAAFAAAMSLMYAQEVPQYRALTDLVAAVNRRVLAGDPALAERMARSGETARLAGERHGAIRVGTADELATIARAFAVMGMAPVGYYDLAPAGVPVHATAFRAVEETALTVSPFRVFTSLLRLELIADPALRAEAAAILARRRIVTPAALALIARAEREGGLSEVDAAAFVAALLETFRWHAHATVPRDTYRRLLAAHRLVADVVSFKGPHINHLTPRVLDIDAVQAEMPARGMAAKQTIEGPPKRRCPVLLRQTSFTALEERIAFTDDAADAAGSHTARFGEVEQRGVALTAAGQARYDAWIGNGGALDLPDDWAALRRQGLAFFRYRAADGAAAAAADAGLEDLVAHGQILCDPIVYEDFLPVSAAGIFQSNLGADRRVDYTAAADRAAFEQALGRAVEDPLALCAAAQRASLDAVGRVLGRTLSA